MGEQNVNKLNSKEELQLFVKHLLNDVKALETMLADDERKAEQSSGVFIADAQARISNLQRH